MSDLKVIIVSAFAFLALSVALAGVELMSALKAAKSFKRDDDESIYGEGDE